MRRWTAAAGIAAGIVLTAGACGVQPTGVNVASTSPFSASTTPGSPSASSAGAWPVKVFLVPKDGGLPQPVTHFLPRQPKSPLDLLPALETATTDDVISGLTTSVPKGIELDSTKNAHEYRIISSDRVGSNAMHQMACTFDVWWHAHNDGQNKSTQFILQNGYESGWDDCPSYQATGETATPAQGKPAKATSISPSPFGN